MARMKSSVQALIVASVMLIMLGALLGLWSLYAKGIITKPQYVLYTKKGGLVVIMIFIALALL